MSGPLHSKQKPGANRYGNHPIHSLTYANESDREAHLSPTAGELAALTADDVGRVAYQSNDGTFWLLLSHDPISWGSMTAAPAIGVGTTVGALLHWSGSAWVETDTIVIPSDNVVEIAGTVTIAGSTNIVGNVDITGDIDATGHIVAVGVVIGDEVSLSLHGARHSAGDDDPLQVSATSRILGRKTSGAGDVEELTASDVLGIVGFSAPADYVKGPVSGGSTANALARWDSTTGRLLKDSANATLTDGGALTLAGSGAFGGATAVGTNGIASAGTWAIQSSTEADGTNKVGRWATKARVTAQPPAVMANLSAGETTNILSIGGGTSIGQAATQISLYTAAAVNTTTGTEQWRIDSSGHFLNPSGGKNIASNTTRAGTFFGGAVDVSGNGTFGGANSALSIGSGAGAPQVIHSKADASNAFIAELRSGGSAASNRRWLELSAATSHNWRLNRYDSGGTFVDTAFEINWADGEVRLNQTRPRVAGLDFGLTGTRWGTVFGATADFSGNGTFGGNVGVTGEVTSTGKVVSASYLHGAFTVITRADSGSSTQTQNTNGIRYLDAGSNAIEFTFLSAAAVPVAGRIQILVIKNSGTNPVTLKPASGQTLNAHFGGGHGADDPLVIDDVSLDGKYECISNGSDEWDVFGPLPFVEPPVG